MIVNQRIDHVQEQTDTLWQLAQLGCQWNYSGLCITSIQYENYTRAANLSKQLSKYLLGNWIGEFDSLMDQLRVAIVTVNSARVDASLSEGLSSWIVSAMNHFMEWAGVVGVSVLLCGGVVFLLWLVCKLCAQKKRDKVVIAQAHCCTRNRLTSHHMVKHA